jgi:hypothetical protein
LLKGLLKKDLLAERPAAADEARWHETKDGGRTTPVMADNGVQAIGVDADEKTSKQSPLTKSPPKQRHRRADRKPTSRARPMKAGSPYRCATAMATSPAGP